MKGRWRKGGGLERVKGREGKERILDTRIAIEECNEGKGRVY